MPDRFGAHEEGAEPRVPHFASALSEVVDSQVPPREAYRLLREVAHR